jgi:hypothetical protein
VRITHGISSHGIALNVTTDLSTYKHIVPCGTPDKEITSVMQELQKLSSCNGCNGSNGSYVAGGCKPGVMQHDSAGQQLQQSQAVAPARLVAAAEACLVSAFARMTGLDAVSAHEPSVWST